MFWGSVRDLQRRQRQSQPKTSHLKSLWAFQTFFIEIISTRLKRQIYVSFLELNFWDRTQSWEGERKICHGVVTSSLTLPVREFTLQSVLHHVQIFFFANLSLPSPSSLKKLPNLFNRNFPLWSCKKTFSFGHIISPLLAKPIQSR